MRVNGLPISVIRIHSVLLPAFIYRGSCLSLLSLSRTHMHTHAHNKGSRSIDEPNEESSCFSAYLLNSISPTRSPCFIHLSVHPFIYPPITLSAHLFFFYLFHTAIHPSICLPHLFLSASIYPCIFPSITTPVNKDTSRIHTVSN